MNFRFLSILLVALTGCKANSVANQPQIVPTPTLKPFVETAFDRYMQRDEPLYKWEIAPVGQYESVEGETNLKLISQSWQNKPWTHRMQIFTPEIMKFPDAALINIQFGSGSFLDSFLARSLANATGATVVNLFNVPNQPLYGKREDDLLAYSFARFIETGDETWPILYPMTKSVVKAMDASQDWSKKAGKTELKRFIITGASKRGWTTYYTGATQDPRLVGLIPIVYNNLNIGEQIKNQNKIWGGTSPMAAPYANIGLFDLAVREEGQKTVAAIDPYALRDRLTVPKLMVNATNDEFWAHNSEKFYFDQIPGDNRIFYVPNATHILGESAVAAAGSAAAWSKIILKGQTVPNVTMSVQKADDKWVFEAKPIEATPKIMRLWFASAPKQDFRQSQWESVELQPSNGAYKATLNASQLFKNGDNAAAFAEIEVASTPLPLRISSKMWETNH